MCDCNRRNANSPNIRQQVPNVTKGTNQILLQQIAEQQRQQAEIQRAIQSNQKTVVKTYRYV